MIQMSQMISHLFVILNFFTVSFRYFVVRKIAAIKPASWNFDLSMLIAFH